MRRGWAAWTAIFDMRRRVSEQLAFQGRTVTVYPMNAKRVKSIGNKDFKILTQQITVALRKLLIGYPVVVKSIPYSLSGIVFD